MLFCVAGGSRARPSSQPEWARSVSPCIGIPNKVRQKNHNRSARAERVRGVRGEEPGSVLRAVGSGLGAAGSRFRAAGSVPRVPGCGQELLG